MIYHDTDTTIDGTRCSLTGEAVFSVSVDDFNDADIGGSDGAEVTGCELLRFELDGLHLTREQVELVLGRSGLRAWEDAVACRVAENLTEHLEAA